MEFSNIPNAPKRNQALVNASLIMGIISIVIAFTCLSFLTPVFGGLGILFALLSQGREKNFDKKAKTGLVLSTISLVATVILTVITLVFTYNRLSGYDPDELHDYLNEAYEETYGKSFDELYEDFYGEDFGEVYDDWYNNIYGNK